MRLGRGHRDLGKRRWDEAVQRHLIDMGYELPWYEVATDRTMWNSLELPSLPGRHGAEPTSCIAERHQAAFPAKIRTLGFVQCAFR